MVYNIMMNNRKRANLSLLFFTFRKKLIFYVEIYFNRKYEHENITKIDFCYINIINILICRYIEI